MNKYLDTLQFTALPSANHLFAVLDPSVHPSGNPCNLSASKHVKRLQAPFSSCVTSIRRPDDETPVVDNTTASVSSNPFAGDEEETEEENVEPEQEVEAAKAPVEKPKSIFSFSTPKT